MRDRGIVLVDHLTGGAVDRDMITAACVRKNRRRLVSVCWSGAGGMRPGCGQRELLLRGRPIATHGVERLRRPR